MHFKIPTEPDTTADEFVISQTRQYNADFVPNDFEPLSVHCRDDDNCIIGGLTGKTYWRYLDIEYLWVDKAHRGKGIASKIIQMAEQRARIRNCRCSMLDTYEFQALGFYLKQGYEMFGKLDGYCDQYERYFLRKAL